MVDSDAAKNRTFRICVWNPTPSMLTAQFVHIEAELNKLGKSQLVHLDSLDSPKLLPCDLLIMTAALIEDENFETWLVGVEKRVPVQGVIKVPAIIISEASTAVQRSLLKWAVATNWYFDLVHPEHASSLAIRVTNFLRLHDHLHEVQRMQGALDALNTRVQEMEAIVISKAGGP